MADSVSQALFERACRVIPGGVNSPVRAFGAVGGEPIFFKSGQGSRLLAADNTSYLDFVGTWGPAIVGHAHPSVIQAVQQAASHGLSFGAPTEAEVIFAEKLLQLYPSMGKVRAVNSGTEACMSALRLARGAAKRSKIVKFEGCYHGHHDSLLVNAGSGLATLGVPSSAGVPESVVQHTLTLPYNDLQALENTFKTHGNDLAGVIVEPVVGNMGCVPPTEGFLQAIIDGCKRVGAISIFDEVMTGCRLAPGGAQQLFGGLQPDLTCLGKIIGGGMPLAAYGGRSEIMDLVSPLGPVYQAGTLSGNPVAVAAGLATLSLLSQASYDQLERLGQRLEQGFQQLISKHNLDQVCVQRVGSMITLFFCSGPIENWTHADRADRKAFARFHQGLLRRHVYWPPAQFETCFLSLAHTDEDIDTLLQAADESLVEVYA
jgi:glutamate-1-semialdehyde 2,1-aminomutase